RPREDVAGLGVGDVGDALPTTPRALRRRALDGLDVVARRGARRVGVLARDRRLLLEHPGHEPRAIELIEPAARVYHRPVLVLGLDDRLLDGADALQDALRGLGRRRRAFEAEARHRGAEEPVPREPEAEEPGEHEDGRSDHAAHCRPNARAGEKIGRPAYTD